MSTTNAPQQTAVPPPNYAVIPIEQYEGMLNFVNQVVPTGYGGPLKNALSTALTIYAPPGAFTSADENEGAAQPPAPDPGGAEDAVKSAALADDLDKIADIIEGAASAQPPAATPPPAVKAAKPRSVSRRKGR